MRTWREVEKKKWGESLRQLLWRWRQIDPRRSRLVETCPSIVCNVQRGSRGRAQAQIRTSTRYEIHPSILNSQILQLLDSRRNDRQPRSIPRSQRRQYTCRGRPARPSLRVVAPCSQSHHVPAGRTGEGRSARPGLALGSPEGILEICEGGDADRGGTGGREGGGKAAE